MNSNQQVYDNQTSTTERQNAENPTQRQNLYNDETEKEKVEEIVFNDEPTKEQAPKVEIAEPQKEPEEDDPQKVEIVFRLPGAGDRINRRFLKEDKAIKLYEYIDYLHFKGDCSFEVESGANQNIYDRDPVGLYNLILPGVRKVIIKRDSEEDLQKLGLAPRGMIWV